MKIITKKILMFV